MATTAEKKVKGRKRHVVTDTQGHLLHVKSHEANTHDTVAGCLVFEEALEKYPSLQGVCADAGYRGTFSLYVQEFLLCAVEIVQRLGVPWLVQPKRWVVERTFAWMNAYRRLDKDVEIKTERQEAQFTIAHCRLLLRRLFKL